MLSTYQQLKAICGQLRRREKQRRNSSDSLGVDTVSSSSSSDEPTTANSVKAGHLGGAVQELRGLVHDILRKEAKGACLACGGDRDEKLRLEVQLHKTTEAKEKLERVQKQKEDEAKRKDEEILDLKSKVRYVAGHKILDFIDQGRRLLFQDK